jgi:acyl dehydratase
MAQQEIAYEKLVSGYEFAPTSFCLDNEMVKTYLKAVGDQNAVYQGESIVPPMAIAALAMAAMSAGLALPSGAIHVSQTLEFMDIVKVGENLTSHAKVNRKIERGKFHMLTVGIDVLNQRKAKVISGETSFILPLTEGK